MQTLCSIIIFSIIFCQLLNFSLSKQSRQALVLTPHDYLVHDQPLIVHTSIIGVTEKFQMMWTPPFHTFRVHRFTPTFLYYIRNQQKLQLIPQINQRRSMKIPGNGAPPTAEARP